MAVRLLLIAQWTGEVPVPGRHLPACPALVILLGMSHLYGDPSLYGDR